MLEEFEDDFGRAKQPSKETQFYKGGTQAPGGSSEDSQRPLTKRTKYTPPIVSHKGITENTSFDLERESDEDDSELPLAALTRSRGGKKMHSLLNDIKRKQEARELGGLSKETVPQIGSYDVGGDSQSTNLFIDNLAPNVDEHVLLREFGRFGPIASVKIMWPRDEEQRRKGKNNGFIAFMKRADAEKALSCLNGADLFNFKLSLGWGKAMPLPPEPIYGAPTPEQFNRPRGVLAPEIIPAPQSGSGPDFIITVPEDPRQKFVIDATAVFVVKDGTDFEQIIMEQEVNNPEFVFMYDVDSPEHLYYRWRIYSLSNGDTLLQWRVEPFLLVEGSNRWIPPAMTVTQLAERDNRKDGNSSLSDGARERFLELLESLTLERDDIYNAMSFAMDHSQSACDLEDILIERLVHKDTPVPLKIARLYLLSDILYNSGASGAMKNARKFRSRFADDLPDVFESLAEAARGMESRMAQEVIRKYVLKVLKVWREWYVFSEDIINGFESSFSRGDLTGHRPALKAELEKLTDEDLEIRCKRTGLSRRGGKAAQIERLLALDVHLHGEMPPEERAAAEKRRRIEEKLSAAHASGWQDVST